MSFNLKNFFGIVASKKYRPKHFNSIITTGQYRLPYEVTLNYLKSGSRVLDWGCGNGHFSHFLEYCKMETHAYGFDFPASFGELTSVNFTCGNDAEPINLQYEDKLFDAVISMGVLEHVHEYAGSINGSMAEMNRILKEDGLFMCFHFPNKYGWLESILKKIKGSNFGHSRRFSIKDIKNIIESGGFDLVEVGRYNFLPRNLFMRVDVPFESFISPFYDFIDRLLSILFNVVCQNYYFIARKRIEKKSN